MKHPCQNLPQLENDIAVITVVTGQSICETKLQSSLESVYIVELSLHLRKGQLLTIVQILVKHKIIARNKIVKIAPQ